MPTHQQVQQWYDRHYHGQTDQQFEHDDERWNRWFFERLALPAGGRLLDVGCGSGVFLKLARQRGFEVAGIDISQVAIDAARQRVPEAQLHQGPAEELPFGDDQFDVVVCLGSLEHFLDIPKAVRQLARVARAGAPVHVVVPNRQYLGYWFTRQAGTYQQDISEALLNRDEWRKLLEANGLVVKAVKADTRPQTWAWCMQKGSPRRKVARMIKACLLRLAPLRWQYTFIFTATPS